MLYSIAIYFSQRLFLRYRKSYHSKKWYEIRGHLYSRGFQLTGKSTGVDGVYGLTVPYSLPCDSCPNHYQKDGQRTLHRFKPQQNDGAKTGTSSWSSNRSRTTVQRRAHRLAELLNDRGRWSCCACAIQSNSNLTLKNGGRVLEKLVRIVAENEWNGSRLWEETVLYGRDLWNFLKESVWRSIWPCLAMIWLCEHTV